MYAIEKTHPPSELQIEEGAGLDPSVHGFHGVVNVSFPVSNNLRNLLDPEPRASMASFN